MSISRGNAPAAAEAPSHCAGAVARCRVGDWVYPADTFDWWGLKGVQRYQADAPAPFDPATFDPRKPVWSFERTDHPAAKLSRGQSCQVWKRIA